MSISTDPLFPIGSKDGLTEAHKRIAEAKRVGAEELDIGGLGLTVIPDELQELHWLKILYLGLRKKIALPKSKSRHDLARGTSRNALNCLPTDFFTSLSHLRCLYLEHNNLSILPDNIGRLSWLRRIVLDDNQLKFLPESICKLEWLEIISANNNQIQHLPNEIWRMIGLYQIYLGGNELKFLPNGISLLQKISDIDVSNNRLLLLPDNIGSAERLRSFLISENNIGRLPNDLCRLARLEELDIDHNNLDDLPEAIGRLLNLKRLYLKGNQLPLAYIDAWDKGGITALGAAVRAIHDGASPLFEAKLLVAGEGNVGKTWALAALRGEKPSETIGKQTTYGIDRGELRLQHPESGKNQKVPADTEIHFNTWDFGGQRVYRITHQFFYSEDAIFLLIWNPRSGSEQCRVREWLRAIELRTGGKAKVIIVASHSPMPLPYLPEPFKERLPAELRAMIVGEIAIDSETGSNIGELRSMIAENAVGLRFVGEQFPTRWRRAREAVGALNSPDEKNRLPYISYARFEEICSEHGITDGDQVFTLATVFMHSLGRSIYYGRRAVLSASNKGSKNDQQISFEDTFLSNIMVLDAEWLSRAFVQVLEYKPAVDSGGLLDHSWLDSIWRTHGRAESRIYRMDEHPYLMRLMHAFDMSYVLKGHSGTLSLLPQLLPVGEPELPWQTPRVQDGVQPMRLICRLENEAPGLMVRFIVHTAPYHVHDANGRGAYWHDGVFLRDTTGNEVLVKLAGTEKPILTMLASGPQPGWFLKDLSRTLLTLLEFWPGLNKALLVGCPTRDAEGQFCKGEFEFDFLLAEHKEEPDIAHSCRVCRERRTSRELLFGYAGVAEERKRLHRREEYFFALQEAPCPRAFTLTPEDWAWYDPVRYVPRVIVGKKLRLTLHSEHSLIPVADKVFEVSPTWIRRVGPLARLMSMVLTGMTIPLAGETLRELERATKFMKDMDGIAKEQGASLRRLSSSAKSREYERVGWLSGADLEELHNLLKEIGLAPQFGGMKFVKIRHKGYLWVSKEEAEAHAEEIPYLAYMPFGGS